MKIIFLDIDWVLVKFNENTNDLNPELVENLKHILNNANADIVISSDRRFDMALLNGVFAKFDIPFISTTRLEEDKIYDFTDHGIITSRENDILEYLKWNKKQIFKYVIIDDLPLKMSNFYKTNSNIGLTREISDKIILFLNKK